MKRKRESLSELFDGNPRGKYLFAVVVMGFAILLQWILKPIISLAVFVILYPATFLIAWIAGFGPALLAITIGAISAFSLFLVPYLQIAQLTGNDAARIGIFITGATLISWIVARGTASEKRAKRKLRDSEAQLITILENLTEGLIVSDLDGRIIEFNKAVLQLYGFSGKEEARRALARFGDHFDVVDSSGTYLAKDRLPLQRIIRGEEIRDLDVTVRSRSPGSPVRILSYGGTLVHDDRGVPRMAVMTIRDISDRKRAEAELREARDELEMKVEERTAELKASNIALIAANKELESFSYSISHDLRSPLRGIDGFSKLLIAKYAKKLDEQGQSYLERIRAATQRMGQLIDDILKLSRLIRVEMKQETVDIGEIAGKIVQDLRVANPERSVKVKIEAGLQTTADSTLLTAALENLIGNAWKFTSAKRDARIVIGKDLLGGVTVFYVEDNGAGFDMKYSDQLFGAFQRLHKAEEFPGMGIGLASVRRVIHRHGGEVWAKAAPGEGAKFYFTIGQSKPEPLHRAA